MSLLLSSARWVRAVACSLAIVVAAASPAVAAPDFSGSELRATPDPPREGDIVTFAVIVRNTGADDAASVYAVIEWPLMAFLVDSAGLEDAEVDHRSRTLTLAFPLAAGAERPFTVRVLAPRDSGGDALTLALRASHFASGTDHFDRATVTVETRIARDGVRLAGFRLAPAGLVTLALLGLGVVLWLAVRAPSRAQPRIDGFSARIGPGAAVAAVIIALGFWTMFGAMAWRDYQSATTWVETTCTVLGGRASAYGTLPRRGNAGREPLDDTAFVPVLGLRYDVDRQVVFSSGYDTGSRLGVGASGRVAELDRWTIGATTPCWYNPADPRDVVVVNGFGGAYLFAVFPLPVFLIGAARLRTLLR